MPNDVLLAQAADIWRSSGFAIALTGAGISVPSGIPDFRSPGGLWTRFDPDQAASSWALKNNPRAVWEFLLEAERMFAFAAPNPAHQALVGLEQAGFLKAVITQNVDGLHHQAGSVNVVEFHGNCLKYFCNGCRRDHSRDLVLELAPSDLPWMCDHCGHVVRPDLVFFGEPIPAPAMNAAISLSAQADLAVIIGTSGDVAPVNAIPWQIKQQGGRVLEINLGATSYGNLADVRLNLPAEECLPALAELLLRP